MYPVRRTPSPEWATTDPAYAQSSRAPHPGGPRHDLPVRTVVRHPPAHGGPMRPRIELSPMEREAAAYALASDRFGDPLTNREMQDMLIDRIAMENGQRRFRYPAANLTPNLVAQDNEGAHRLWAARDSPVAVLRRGDDPRDLPHSVALGRFTNAAACHELTMAAIDERLDELDFDRDGRTRMHVVDHNDRDHFWAERETPGQRTSVIDGLTNQVHLRRHGEFSHDIDDTHSSRSYRTRDLPDIERDIRRHERTMRAREPEYQQQVALQRLSNRPFIGMDPVSGLHPDFSERVRHRLTRSEILDRLERDDPRHPQHIPLSPETRRHYEDLLREPEHFEHRVASHALIHGVDAARRTRRATIHNGRGEAPPPLDIGNAAREAPGLVRRATQFDEPYDWSNWRR